MNRWPCYRLVVFVALFLHVAHFAAVLARLLAMRTISHCMRCGAAAVTLGILSAIPDEMAKLSTVLAALALGTLALAFATFLALAVAFTFAAALATTHRRA